VSCNSNNNTFNSSSNNSNSITPFTLNKGMEVISNIGALTNPAVDNSSNNSGATEMVKRAGEMNGRRMGMTVERRSFVGEAAWVAAEAEGLMLDTTRNRARSMGKDTAGSEMPVTFRMISRKHDGEAVACLFPFLALFQIYGGNRFGSRLVYILRTIFTQSVVLTASCRTLLGNTLYVPVCISLRCIRITPQDAMK